MRVGTREIPKDELSFEHDGYSVHVFTHRGSVNVIICKEGQEVHGASLSPEQLISLLTRDAR